MIYILFTNALLLYTLSIEQKCSYRETFCWIPNIAVSKPYPPIHLDLHYMEVSQFRFILRQLPKLTFLGHAED